MRHTFRHFEPPLKTRSRLRISFGLKLFLSHFLAVIFVSGSIGTYFYFQAMESLLRSLRSRLQNSAALLSQSLDARAMDRIRTAEDVSRPEYEAALTTLRRLRRSNPDIAFLYVMRREGERVSFVVDSDETEAQALPGRVYEETTDLLMAGFSDPSVDEQPYQDEWGVFLSGYAPLREGNGHYLVGIDMRADEVDQKLARLRLTGTISLLASLLLALLFSLYFSRGIAFRINAVIRRCRRVARGQHQPEARIRTHDEFDDLMEAFDLMDEDLAMSRRQTKAALKNLQEAHDHLEVRVCERTAELETALEKVNVLTGLLPICCSCKKIRDDKGYWQQVEQFVSSHTGARFSHGLCPDCGAKMYQDVLSHHPGTESRDDPPSDA